MGYSITRRMVLIVLAICTAACVRDEPARAVTGPSVFTAQVAGQWNGTSTLTNVTGFAGSPGECLGADVGERLRGSIIPTDQMTLSLTQESATIAARFTSGGTGLACSYQGRTALTTLSLSAAACDAPKLVVRCNPDAEGKERVRDLKLAGSTILGTFADGKLDGTITNTYNAFETGNDDGVASIVLNYRYSAIKQ